MHRQSISTYNNIIHTFVRFTSGKIVCILACLSIPWGMVMVYQICSNATSLLYLANSSLFLLGFWPFQFVIGLMYLNKSSTYASKGSTLLYGILQSKSSNVYYQHVICTLLLYPTFEVQEMSSTKIRNWEGPIRLKLSIGNHKPIHLNPH